jgi:hypothetical protein
MRGKVIIGFASANPDFNGSEGDVIDIPDDVDWVRAGFVEVLPDEVRPVIVLDESELPDEVKKYTKNLKKMVEDTSMKTPEKAVTRQKGKGESRKPTTKAGTTSKSISQAKPKR